MMNKLFTMCLVILLTGSTTLALDINIPTWRGVEGSTYQKWEFSTPDLMPVPEVGSFNPYGQTLLRVTPYGGWIPEPIGAWSLSGEIDVLIPNLDIPRPEKWIRIQLTWQAADNDGFLPGVPLVGVVAFPDYDVISIGPRTDINVDGWIHSTYDIVIKPNPSSEWIAIKGDITVDELVIDTICVPEPATMTLLGLGGLALMRKRRI